MNNLFSIRPFEPSDAIIISAFMRSQTVDYIRFFYAFGSDEESIANILSASKKDVYSGVFWNRGLIGIFMLRGWDEGYELPFFGVLIDEKHRGKAILQVTVETAKLICKLSGLNRYMVKIHPDNAALRNVQKMGFYQTGVEESTGNVIFHLDF